MRGEIVQAVAVPWRSRLCACDSLPTVLNIVHAAPVHTQALGFSGLSLVYRERRQNASDASGHRDESNTIEEKGSPTRESVIYSTPADELAELVPSIWWS